MLGSFFVVQNVPKFYNIRVVKIFGGWFADAEFTEEVTSISVDTHENKKIYAKFHDVPVQRSEHTCAGRKYSYCGSGSGTSQINNSVEAATL